MPHYTTKLTLEQQIGQVLMVGFRGTSVTAEVRELISKHHIGGVILFSRNIHDPQQIYDLTQELQQIARAAGQPYPLLIATDQENGMVRRLGDGATLFPGNMALGAIGSEQIAFDIAQSTGCELRALGINLNLAPVVDVNNNPANPVIGVRSFGEDPQQVASLAEATISGYRASGVLTCLKHFPGHGDTAVDSHLALPVIPYTLERLETIELVPFKRGIEAGAESIMIAHLYLPQLMSDATLPSTVSPEIVRGLLREKLGYQGLIITDCLEMRAVTGTIGTERGTVMALQAGNDIALISHTYERQKGSIAAIQEAVQSGQLHVERIQEAAERVLEHKARTLSWESLPEVSGLAEVGSEAHRRLRERAYDLSTTLVRNDAGLIPLALEEGTRILVVFIKPGSYTMAVERFAPDPGFAAQLRQRYPQVDAVTIESEIADEGRWEDLDQAVASAELLIVVTANAHLESQQGQIVQHLQQSGRQLIAIAAYNPYDLLAYPQVSTYLVTYEYTAPALAAAARVLLGLVPAQGHLPITLPVGKHA